jgi:hypothetical protein
MPSVGRFGLATFARAESSRRAGVSVTRDDNMCQVTTGLVAVTLPIALIIASASVLTESRIDKLPRLPDATLLLEYPNGELTLTTGHATQILDSGRRGWYVIPSMSADGRFVAGARLVTPPTLSAPRRPEPAIVGIYSTKDKRWTDTSLQVTGGPAALSADGSRLACLSIGTPDASARIQVLDLRDGTVKTRPVVKGGNTGSADRSARCNLSPRCRERNDLETRGRYWAGVVSIWRVDRVFTTTSLAVTTSSMGGMRRMQIESA